MLNILYLSLALAAGFLIAQQTWVLWQLIQTNPGRAVRQSLNTAGTKISRENIEETGSIHIVRQVEIGIERITCTPPGSSGRTPILLLHGMFHDAWIWHLWQRRLAEMGRPSGAFSLPGTTSTSVRNHRLLLELSGG